MEGAQSWFGSLLVGMPERTIQLFGHKKGESPIPKWKRLPRAAKGHKWFRDEESGRIAVAEGNTVMPDKLAKGILWLNPNKPITLDSRWSCYLVMFAPVISARTDEPRLIAINVNELRYLTREHGMRLCIVGENGETMELKPAVPRKKTQPRPIGGAP